MWGIKIIADWHLPVVSTEIGTERACYRDMSSFPETKAEKYVNKIKGKKFLQYNRLQLSRIYPKGQRLDSSNYDPLPMWICGSQLVALNFQTPGEANSLLNILLWLAYGRNEQYVSLQMLNWHPGRLHAHWWQMPGATVWPYLEGHTLTILANVIAWRCYCCLIQHRFLCSESQSFKTVTITDLLHWCPRFLELLFLLSSNSPHYALFSYSYYYGFWEQF